MILLAEYLKKQAKDDMRIFYEGMCTKLYPTMDILEKYLKEE